MKLQEIIVRFKGEDGTWEEEEQFLIDNSRKKTDRNTLHQNAPLIAAARSLQENTVGKIPGGDSFLLVKKIYKYDIKDYLKKLDEVKEYDDDSLIQIGDQLPLLINKALSFSDKTKKLVEFVLSAKLNKEDLEQCIPWLENVKVKGIYVDDIIQKLKKIKSKQKGLHIEDIHDVYILNQISQWYIDLRAYKKAKKILFRSLDIEEKNTVTLNILGKISRLTKRFDKGIGYYSKALKIKENVYSYNGLGGIYRDQHRLQDAEKSYLKALELPGVDDHRYTHMGLGAVYYDKKLYDLGNEHFLKADYYDEAWYRKEFYRAKKEGLLEKSIAILRLILQLDEYNTWAQQTLTKELKFRSKESD
jgi:tetratricopeptide (TPR) repeat protein